MILYLTALRSTSKTRNENSFLLSDKDTSNSSSLFGVEDSKQKSGLQDSKPQKGQLFQSAMLQPLASSPIKGQDRYSISGEWAGEIKPPPVDMEYLSREPEEVGFWDSTKHLLRWSTINLVVAMWSCAVFPALFTTLGPMFIGRLLQDKRYVALFGICAGVGEIGGSLIAGKVISRFGIKKSAVLIAVIAGLSLLLSAVAFPLKAAQAPLLPPSPALFLFLGICLGIGDSSTGVILSTLIGRVYREMSQAGFALYSLVFNVACTTLYLISSYCEFQVVVWVMVSIVCFTLLSILLMRRGNIAAEEKKS